MDSHGVDVHESGKIEQYHAPPHQLDPRPLVLGPLVARRRRRVGANEALVEEQHSVEQHAWILPRSLHLSKYLTIYNEDVWTIEVGKGQLLADATAKKEDQMLSGVSKRWLYVSFETKLEPAASRWFARTGPADA
jgi:hypothetical protein